MAVRRRRRRIQFSALPLVLHNFSISAVRFRINELQQRAHWSSICEKIWIGSSRPFSQQPVGRIGTAGGERRNNLLLKVASTGGERGSFLALAAPLSLMFCPTKSDSVIGFHCSYGNRHREHLTCHANFFSELRDESLSLSRWCRRSIIFIRRVATSNCKTVALTTVRGLYSRFI